MAQLEFDENLAKQLDVMYRRHDVMRRRHLVQEALAARPGEDVVDVGCGPGFYVAELLEQVGPDGSVAAVDNAPAMLAVASNRARDHDNVTFHQAEATCLPLPDQAFDAALSVQVLEYVSEVDVAVSEIHRVLRPGGRVVIWDVDWETVSWHSRDNERMRAVLRAWDKHLTHRSLPQTLGASMRRAGFHNIDVQAHASATIALDPETYGGSLTDLITQYAVSPGGMDVDDVKAWRAEQQDLAASGEFYFCCTQSCFVARKPRSGKQ
jgi:ubiquinone/menaquinone biosynthesis C-methylase UbiE